MCEHFTPLFVLGKKTHFRWNAHFSQISVKHSMDNIDNQSGERQALLRMASPALSDEDALAWIESVLPRTMRRLMDSENLDMPLLQLPLAQLRLAQALC